MNAITLFDTPIDNSPSGDRRLRQRPAPQIESRSTTASARAEVELDPPSAPQPARLLVDVRAAAQMLSISRALVYELMAAGELPSVVIHRCRRIAVDELHSYVERLGTDR
ncbi:MAG TPA: helix-turn-helix domain-containing protein [Acidimicrobiia bacterium]